MLEFTKGILSTSNNNIWIKKYQHNTCTLQIKPDTSLIEQQNPKEFTGDLKVHFIDVGQADAMLVQLPNGQNMVVDAGGNSEGGYTP